MNAARRVLITAASIAAGGCIIPDSNIIVRGDFTNAGAVRIVEPIPIIASVHDACAAIDGLGLDQCPGVPAGLPSGLVAGGFCTCPAGERDQRAALRFDIFVEDPDVTPGGDPADTILGVFLLDVSAPQNAGRSPSELVAFVNYLAPDQPAALFTAGEFPPIERPDPNLRNFTVGFDEVDLCNDNDGQPLEPGLHELRLIVTDRPWYRPFILDEAGCRVTEDDECLLDVDGEPLRGDPVFGVPDLPSGATYDARTFVFRCYDENDPPPAPFGECLCVAEEP